MRKCREKVQMLFEGNSGLGTEKTSNECQDSTELAAMALSWDYTMRPLFME
jgi:hypothetical protein